VTAPVDMAGVRRHAESLMTSTCTIREEPTGRPVTDPDTGEVTTPPGALVYSGPCRVKPGTATAQRADIQIGGVEFRSFDYRVDVPFHVTGVRMRQRVTIDASPDPALVGIEVEVRHVDRGEHITARRLSCTEVE
jgi:hypothetical protein